MIWFDAHTAAPVAPGSCEDAGTPSFDSYWCRQCDEKQLVLFSQADIDGVVCGIGSSEFCQTVLLTTG